MRQRTDPNIAVTNAFPQREGPDPTELDELPGGRGAVSVIQHVESKAGGVFYDELGLPVLVTPEDEDVANLVVAMRAVFAPALRPTGWQPTKDNPPGRLVVGVTPFAIGSIESKRIIGQDTDRRSFRLAVDVASVIIGPNRESVENGVGYLLSATQMLPLTVTAEIWARPLVAAVAAQSVYFLGESGDTRNVPALGSIAGDAGTTMDHNDPRHRGSHGSR